MNKIYLLCVICSLAVTQFLFAQCPPGQSIIRVEVTPDQYWNEVSWKITNANNSIIYAEGECTDPDPVAYEYCVPAEGCKVFHIIDDFGDGMAPDGTYFVYKNDTLIHASIGEDYGLGESVTFDCLPGTYCDHTLPIDTGAIAFTSSADMWYRFVPADTGIYMINTCNIANTCPTKIWVYNRCAGITVSNNQTGAIFYADNGCDNGAMATLYLAGGLEYFIRIGYATDSCANTPILGALTYVGPIVGCTDPAGCDYNPLATVSGPCIYPSSPECLNRPDLLVRQDVMRNSLALDYINNPDDCAVQEGCLHGVGERNVIRFTTQIQNIGNLDYFIGKTPDDPTTPSDQFVWDVCHNHWHYRGYAQYILFNAATSEQVPIGSKNGFCVLDLECDNGGAGKYSCINMGITAGCGDIYDASLDCQWIDITDLAPGAYTLVMRVNWDQSPDKLGRIEKDYNNNWAQACFNLSYDGAIPIVDFINDNCLPFVDCLGVPYGNAQVDCEGTCNGPVIRGDWDKNAVRDAIDVQDYLAASLAGDADATECRDLFDNNQIDVYDAALLQECALHSEDPTYWGTRFPCQFPGGMENPKDIVFLLPGALDTIAKTFDVQMMNLFNKQIGYQFSVSGLQISSVENLAIGFDAPIQFDNTGELIALSPTESGIKKSTLPTNFVRIHYSQLTAPQVCVSGVTAVVNNKYQRSNATVASPACVNTNLTATDDPNGPAFAVFVQPNPFTESATLSFYNPHAEPMAISLTDGLGRTVRSFANIRTESFTFERDDLPAGVYFYTIRSAKGSVRGKIAAQ